MINLRINSSGSTTDHSSQPTRITVIGVGGAGGNAVNNMISSGLEGVDFVVCNTDAQALAGSQAKTRIQLGENVTGGMGAGARPDIGKAAAEETIDEILKLVQNTNMVFITAGMGGGTGTGAAPVIAKACRDLGVLTVGVVTKPFQFEGSSRLRMAEQGIAEMQEFVDTLIVIPNQNLFRIANEKTTFAEAFKLADSVLQAGVRSITDLIVRKGDVNLDFADVKSVMTEMGKAVMGTGEATGEKRALEAAEKAISNPLLDDVSMRGAKAVLINVTGGSDMTLYEVDEACNRIREEVDADANIIFGSALDESLAGTMRVSVVATGMDRAEAKASGSSTSGHSHTGSSGNSNVTAVGGGSASGMMGGFGKLPERSSFPKYQAPAATERQSAQPVSRQATHQPVTQQQQPAQQQEHPVQQQPAATASDMFAGLDAPRPEVTQQFVSQPGAQAAPAQAQAPQQQAVPRHTVYKDAFIPPKPAEVDQQLSATPVGAQSYNPAYNPGAVTQAPAAYEPPPLTLTRPVSQPTFTAPPLPSVVKGPQAETQVHAQPTPKKAGGGLLGRLASGNWMPNLSRHSDEAEDSFGPAPRAAQQPTAPAATSAATSSVTPAATAGQGALNIDAPVKKPQGNYEDELDIPAFLRRQAN